MKKLGGKSRAKLVLGVNNLCPVMLSYAYVINYGGAFGLLRELFGLESRINSILRHNSGKLIRILKLINASVELLVNRITMWSIAKLETCHGDLGICILDEYRVWVSSLFEICQRECVTG